MSGADALIVFIKKFFNVIDLDGPGGLFLTESALLDHVQAAGGPAPGVEIIQD